MVQDSNTAAAAARARADSVRGTTSSNVNPETSTQNPTGPTQPLGSDSASAQPVDTTGGATNAGTSGSPQPDDQVAQLNAEQQVEVAGEFRGTVNQPIQVTGTLAGEGNVVWTSNAGNPSVGSQTDSGAVLVYSAPGTYLVTATRHNPDPVATQAMADRGEKAPAVTYRVVVE